MSVLRSLRVSLILLVCLASLIACERKDSSANKEQMVPVDPNAAFKERYLEIKERLIEYNLVLSDYDSCEQRAQNASECEALLAELIDQAALF